MNPLKIIKNGIIDENPTFSQVIGMCPTLAVTTSFMNGLGMGLSTTAVLICSNIAISLIRKIVPDQVRIPCFIVVIAGFVTLIQMLLKAYVPALNASLGMFIPVLSLVVQKHTLQRTALLLLYLTVLVWVLVLPLPFQF